jgi:hypothetical protein
MSVICQLVSTSFSLQHLNLTETQMTEDSFSELIDAISTSVSLLAVHLTGNPGIGSDLSSTIQTQLEDKLGLQQTSMNVRHHLTD